MLNSTIKSIRQILLTSVTLFETHRLGPIKILILKIKSINYKKKKRWPNHPIGGGLEPPPWPKGVAPCFKKKENKNKNKRKKGVVGPSSESVIFFFFFF
jgi:hypothetical protein